MRGMNKVSLLLKIFGCLFFLSSGCLQKPDWADSINFDIAMGKGTPYFVWCLFAEQGNYTICTHPAPARDLYFFLKGLHQKNSLARVAVEQQPKIPKIIHMIWLGKEFPEKFHAYRNSWIEKHPEWTHILWIDNPINYKYGTAIEDIANLKQDLLDDAYATKQLVISIKDIQLHNKSIFDAAENLAEKSDILRYELLYRLGGVYVDTDFECIKPLDILNHCYDFYCGIQPLDECLALNIALFGSKAHHPILKHCIATIKENQTQDHLIKRSGPVHFTKSFWATAASSGINIALPATFFYPLPLYQKYISNEQKRQFIKPESFGIHHWAASWH